MPFLKRGDWQFTHRGPCGASSRWAASALQRVSSGAIAHHPPWRGEIPAARFDAPLFAGMTATTHRAEYGARRRHPVFDEHHHDLRATVRRFVETELTPHVEEWEKATFPDWVFRRLGGLGLLVLDKPEEYRGQGGDYFTAIVLDE